MSFNPELTLTDGTNINVVSTISVKDDETIRRDASRGLSLPYTLRIGTKKTGSGITTLNRHLVRLDSIVNYDVDDPAAKIGRSVYFNIIEPEVIFDATEVQIMIDQLAAFLTAPNVVKLLNGES